MLDNINFPKANPSNIKSSYEDIIHLPHHVSTTRPHMSVADRAAQFAPFAALTGHDAAVKETARLTHIRQELDEEEKEILDEKLQLLKSNLNSQPEIQVTYFIPDEKKEGGQYITVSGKIKKIDVYNRMLYMDNDHVIPMEEISSLEGELFNRM